MASDSPDSGEKTRVLVVPDGLFKPELGKIVLERESILTRTAADVTQALSIAVTFRPHLVIFGSEPAEDAARICALTRIGADAPKLLMVTDRLDRSPNLDASCDAHLVTPLKADELLATIAELVEFQRKTRERAPLDVLVHTEGFQDGGARDATLSSALSLSEDGMLLEAGRHLGLGTHGQLQFFLPGSVERLTLEGAVRVAVDELRLIYVIDFVDLAPQHRALIRKYVASREEAA